MFCSNCGNNIFEKRFCPHCGSPNEDLKQSNNYINQYNSSANLDKSINKKASIKVLNLVIGIISIVIAVITSFQSCLVGCYNAISESEDMSGSAGFLLTLAFLVSGIVGIAAGKYRVGAITVACFYIVGGLIAITNVGVYLDLYVWSILAFIFGILYIITAVRIKK